MRILEVVHGWFPRHHGGTESYVARLASEMRQRGHEVVILAGSDIDRPGAVWEREEWDGHSVYVVHRSGLYLESWYRSYSAEAEQMIGEVLDETRPEVVHIHHWLRLTRNLAEIATRRGIPVVVTLHDTHTTCPKTFRIRENSFCTRAPTGDNCLGCAPAMPFQQETELRAAVDDYRDDFRHELLLATKIIAPSQALADVVQKHFPEISGAIDVCPHGALEFFEPSTISHPRKRDDVIRAAYWGRITPMKGVQLILNALLQMRERDAFSVDVWGTFEGQGTAFENEIRTLVEKLPVRLRGPFAPADIPTDVYDVAIFPSICLESYSFTVDEAFARGIPVIVPDRGAPMERLGGAGTIFQSESADDLKRQLLRIVKRPALLSEWRRKIRSPVPFGAHADRILESYERAKIAGPRIDRLENRLPLARAVRVAAQLEARDREVYHLIGRVEQEADRVRNVEREALLREETTRKHLAVIEDFGKSLAQLTLRIEARDGEYRALEAALADAKNTVAARDRDLAGFALSNTDLRRLLTEKDTAISDLRTEIDRLETDCRGYLGRIAELETEIKAHVARHEADRALIAEHELNGGPELRSARDRVRELEIEVASRRREVQEQSLHISDLRAGLTDAQQRTAELRRWLDETTIAKEERDREWAASRAELDQLRKSTESIRERAAAEAAEHARMAAELERFASERVALDRELEESRNALRGIVEAKKIEETTARTTADQAQRIATLLAEVAALNEAFDRQENVRENLARLLAQRDEDADRRREELRLRDEALGIAVADAASLRATEMEYRRLLSEINRRLNGIASESAGRPMDGAVSDVIFEHVVANHERLHRLIRERDEVLNVLVDKVGGKSGTTGSIQLAGTALDTDQLVDRLVKRRRPRRPIDRSGRLRILFVIHDFLPKHAAGTEIYTFHLATELAKRHDVHLIFCEEHYDKERYSIRKGIFAGLPFTEVVHNYVWENFEESYRDPKMDAIFAGVLEEFAPDLVHIQHLHHFSMDFIRVAKAFGAPVVYTLHEFMLLCARGGQLLREDMEICEQPVPTKCADCIAKQKLGGDYGQGTKNAAIEKTMKLLPPTLREAFSRFAGPTVPVKLDDRWRKAYADAAKARLDYIGQRLKDVDLFISPSRFLRSKFIASGLVRDDQIRYSDNGFDLTPFKDVKRIPSKSLRFGFVGTVAEYKGVHVLLDAFKRLSGPEVELHIYGDLNTFADYKQRLVPLLNDPRVKAHGRFDPKAVAEVMAKLDVLVVPSLWFENSPLTIHEAWLAGIPVIASDRGGMAELVADGQNGLWFRLGDPIDLAAKMQMIVDDRSLLSKFTKNLGKVKPIDENAREIEEWYYDLVTGVVAK